MSIFRRGTKAPAPASLEAAPSLGGNQYSPPLTEAKTPQAFLEEHREALNHSAELWQGIAAFSDIGSDQNIVSRVRESMRSQNTPELVGYTPRSFSPGDAARWTSEYGVFFLVASRQAVGEHKKDTMASARATNELTSNNNPFIKAVINNVFPKQTLMGRTLPLVKSIREADAIARPVVEDLVQTLRDNPRFARELLETKKSEEEFVPEIEELRSMIAVDWHHPDPEKSLLRKYARELEEHPEYQLEQFLQAVAEGTQNRRYAGILEMARFAMLCQGVEKPEGVHSVLRQTFPHWSSFDQLDRAFKDFVSEAIQEERQCLNVLAGQRGSSHLRVRMHRTRQDLYAISDVVTNMFIPRDRRRTNHVRKDDLPSHKDLVSEASHDQEAAEEEPKKPLYTLKPTPKGVYELVETEIEDLLKKFGFEKHPPEYQEDIIRMIESIRDEPLGRGTKKIERNTAVIRINSSSVRLRRFAPSGRNIGRASQDTNHLRIAYGITHGGIVIGEILKHDEFDKKY